MGNNFYFDFFGLKRQPFGISPQHEFFFGGANRENFLRELTHFSKHGEGIALITAEVGCGKTMQLSMLLRESAKDKSIVIILINNAMAQLDELIRIIALQLDIFKKDDLRSAIEKKIIDNFASGLRTLIIIDEGQHTSNEGLEYIRMLSNLETSQGKMLQIIISAQPEILTALASFEMRAFCDRITLHVPMRGLNKIEAGHYIDHRLRLAGYRGDALFSDEAVAEIAEHTLGLNRKIHILADKSLMAAYVSSSKVVKLENVKQAIGEMFDSQKVLQKDLYKPINDFNKKSKNTSQNFLSFFTKGSWKNENFFILAAGVIFAILLTFYYFNNPIKNPQLQTNAVKVYDPPKKVKSERVKPVIKKEYQQDLPKEVEKLELNELVENNNKNKDVVNAREGEVEQSLSKYNPAIYWQINQKDEDLPTTAKLLGDSKIILAQVDAGQWFVRLLSTPIYNLKSIEKRLRKIQNVSLFGDKKLLVYRYKNYLRVSIIGYKSEKEANRDIRTLRRKFTHIVPVSNLHSLPISHLYRR